ncbi:MAG: hypothetical protein J7513_11500 [Solirubrobacteraceae bacterium]|nr:hypothetical protein [Solirubrobacteraceae bacterium]
MPLSSLYLNPTPPAVPWASPALAVKRPNGPNPALEDVAYTDLAASKPQNVRVTAGCTGSTPTGTADVQLQIWAAMFNISLSNSLFLASMGGNSGVQVPITLPAPGADVFDQPWDLTAADVAAVAAALGQPVVTADGDVHSCLYANVFGQGFGGKRNTLNDNTNGVWDAAGNPRHAQRNTTVRAAPPGKLMPFKMWAGNQDPESGQEYVYEVLERHPRELSVWEVEQIAAAVPWIEAPGLKVSPGRTGLELKTIPNRLLRAGTSLLGSAGILRTPKRDERELQRGLLGLEARIGGERLPLLTAREPLKEFALEIDGAKLDRLQKVGLEADDTRAITFQFELPREERVVRVFDAVQRDPDGRVLDGARITLVSAPEGVE